MVYDRNNKTSRACAALILASVGIGSIGGCGPAALTAAADQSVYSGEEVRLAVASIAGIDGTLFWEQVSGPEVVLENAQTSEAVFVAPDVDETTTLEFRITVFSTIGTYQLPLGFNSLSVDGELTIPFSDTLVVTVTPSPLPEVDAGLNFSVNSGETVTLSGEGSTELEEAELEFEWTQRDGIDVTIEDADTATATWVAPDVTEPTVFLFALTVLDGRNSATDLVAVTVEPAKPTAIAGADQVVTETVEVTLDASASTDTRGGLLNYLWEQIDGTSVNITGTTAPRAFFTAPTVGEAAVLRFQITVTNEFGGVDTDDVFVTVVPHGSPTALITGDTTVYEGVEITLSGSSSVDPAGGGLSYEWSVVSTGLSLTLTNSQAEIITFTAPTVTEDSVLTLSLRVEADDGTSGTTGHDVTVQPYPDPITEAGKDASVNEGTTVTLDGSASKDPVGGKITYKWTLPGGISVSDSTTAKPVFTAPTVSKNTVYTFTLRVTNEQGDTTSDTVDITVLNL